VVPPNITTGGRLKGSTPDQIAAAIRHGVRADGRRWCSCLRRTSTTWATRTWRRWVAYLQSLPPSANDPGPVEVRPLARVLWLFGKFPLAPAEALDHRRASAPHRWPP
jgi:hypothetical protein